jgi:hypothetical protein
LSDFRQVHFSRLLTGDEMRIFAILFFILVSYTAYSVEDVSIEFIPTKKGGSLIIDLSLKNNSNVNQYVINNLWVIQGRINSKVDFLHGILEESVIFTSIYYFPYDTYFSSQDFIYPKDYGYFPKVIKLSPNQTKKLTLIYYNDPNIKKIYKSDNYKVVVMLSYASQSDWQKLINEFGNVINQKAINRLKKTERIPLNLTVILIKSKELLHG